jgi:hypothetical protein
MPMFIVLMVSVSLKRVMPRSRSPGYFMSSRTIFQHFRSRC